MNVSKLFLQDLKSLDPEAVLSSYVSEDSMSGANDSTPIGVIVDDSPGSDMGESQDTTQAYNAGEEGKKEDFVDKAIEAEMLEHNRLVESALSDIRVLLGEIERQQDNRFSELSRSVLAFIKSFAERIVHNPAISNMIADSLIQQINIVLSKVKDSGQLSIRIPSRLSESVKSNLVEAFKNTASRLNIEVIEHGEEEEEVAVEWQEGRARFDIDTPMKTIEGELRNFDSTT